MDNLTEEYERILLELSGWMARNTEQVREDELLQKIANMMADDETLMKAIEKKGE